MKTLAGALVSFALLAQVVLTGPAALRTEAAGLLLPSAWHICGVGTADQTDQGDRTPAQPGSAHDHEHCLLCQACAAPLALAEAQIPHVGVYAAVRFIRGPPERRVPDDTRFQSYASRAPPAAA